MATLEKRIKSSINALVESNATPNAEIKEVRLSRKMTLEEWAKKLGTTAGSVGDFESGRRRVPPKIFDKIRPELTPLELRRFGAALKNMALAEYGI